MVNKVILIGNVGQTPNVKYLDGGVAVARFSIATTERYKAKNGEPVEQTEWHNIVAWRQLAEIIEKYVTKGTRVYVEGRLRNTTWEKDGVKHYSNEVQIDNFHILSPKAQDANGAPSPVNTTTTTSVPSASPAENDDDLPF